MSRLRLSGLGSADLLILFRRRTDNQSAHSTREYPWAIISLPSSWSLIPLRDLCEVVQHGYTASAQAEPVGPKFLRITDIVPESINWDTVPYCHIESSKAANYSLQNGDVVIARTGATTGYAKRMRNQVEAVFASYLVRVRVKTDVYDGYIGQVIESEQYKQFIKSHIGGAAQPNANAQVLTSYPMPAPPLLIQKKISSILSAYDDLIENNNRRIKILKEMDQAIYWEWFVNFRFPGHGNVRMVDSELGRMSIFAADDY